MSFRGKRELLVQVAPRYSSARHGQRSVILDEFVAVTGYERKYAIRLLLGPIRPPAPIRRPRVAHYGVDVQQALGVVWSAANGICAKRLVPFLPEFVPTLERHGHLVVTDEVRVQLLELSPATVDRLLRPLRQPHGLSTTKPGRLLKHQIPVRTFAEWTDVKPGFLEGDLVAHCGGTTDGAFLYTFTLTDIATTWTECLALLHRSQLGVVHALEQARRLFPFPILGIDTDNGSEFINEELSSYCTGEQITFTRGRVGNKNDQAWVEQKNGSVVRQLVGYDRFEGQRAYRHLAELYRAVRL
jgi:Integrase core domain